MGTNRTDGNKLTGMLSPVQTVSPLFQHQLQGQQFPVPHIIIMLDDSALPSKGGTGMYLFILRKTLRKDSSDSHLQDVHFVYEL